MPCITFHQGSVENLPFEAAKFDAVMFNQVLHHLEPSQEGDFDGHRIALAEAHRVLRSGGVVIVNCTSHEQLRHGYWYLHLIPTALRALYDRCIPVAKLEAMLSEIGFALEGRFVPLDSVFQGAGLFRCRGGRSSRSGAKLNRAGRWRQNRESPSPKPRFESSGRVVT